MLRKAFILSLLVVALPAVAGAVTYPKQTQPEVVGESIELTGEQVNCILSALPGLNQNFEAEFVSLTLVEKKNKKRTQFCAVASRMKTKTIHSYVNSDEQDPKGIKFSKDGASVFLREQERTKCYNATLIVPVLQCIAQHVPVVAPLHSLQIARQSPDDPAYLESLWQNVTETNLQYGKDRAQGKARRHQ